VPSSSVALVIDLQTPKLYEHSIVGQVLLLVVYKAKRLLIILVSADPAWYYLLLTTTSTKQAKNPSASLVSEPSKK